MSKNEKYERCNIHVTTRRRTGAGTHHGTYYALYTIYRDLDSEDEDGEADLIIQQDDPDDPAGVAFATEEEALADCISQARKRIDADLRR